MITLRQTLSRHDAYFEKQDNEEQISPAFFILASFVICLIVAYSLVAFRDKWNTEPQVRNWLANGDHVSAVRLFSIGFFHSSDILIAGDGTVCSRSDENSPVAGHLNEASLQRLMNLVATHDIRLQHSSWSKPMYTCREDIGIEIQLRSGEIIRQDSVDLRTGNINLITQAIWDARHNMNMSQPNMSTSCMAKGPLLPNRDN